MAFWRHLWNGTQRTEEIIEQVSAMTITLLRESLSPRTDFTTMAETIGYLRAWARRPAAAALAVVLTDARLSSEVQAEILNRARLLAAEELATEWRTIATKQARRAA